MKIRDYSFHFGHTRSFLLFLLALDILIDSLIQSDVNEDMRITYMDSRAIPIVMYILRMREQCTYPDEKRPM